MREGFEVEHRLVRVEWEDSAGLGRWRDLQVVKKEEPLVIVTVGYLLRDDEKGITIAGSWDSQSMPNVADATVIPRSAVRKVESLRRVKGR